MEERFRTLRLKGVEQMEKQKADANRIRFGEVKYVGGKSVCRRCGNSGMIPGGFCTCPYGKTARRV